MPSVSIIVPNFNHAPYLHRRLSSIFDQTFQDFELILLDDASTDDSRVVLESFAEDERVITQFNEVNSGNPFRQWNRGFEMASGDYLWIAESDDAAAPEFLQTLVAQLESNPDAVLATCRAMLMDEQGEASGVFDSYHWFRDARRWEAGYINDGRDEVAQYLSFQNTIPNASGVLIRRSLVANGLRAPEDMRIAGDWSFWVSCLLQGDICHVGEALNYFRRPHAASQRTRTAVSGEEILEGFRVYELASGSGALDDRGRLRAQLGLMKRWLSIASHHPVAWGGHWKIFKKFLGAGFESLWFKPVQLLFAVVAYFLALLSRVPGFRALAVWLQARLTGSARPAGEAA